MATQVGSYRRSSMSSFHLTLSASAFEQASLQTGEPYAEMLCNPDNQ